MTILGREPYYATRRDLQDAIAYAKQELVRDGQEPYRHLIAQKLGMSDLTLRRYVRKFGTEPLETKRAAYTRHQHEAEEAGEHASPDSPFVTTQQAAAYLNLKVKQFEHLARNVPGLTKIQDGRMVRWHKPELAPWFLALPTRTFR